MSTSSNLRLELDPEPPPRAADLAQVPFAILVARARAHSVTGALSIGEDKSIFFLRGAPVDVVSHLPEEITETYMLREGVVREDVVSAARQHAVARGERFGEALLGMGLLRPHELFDHATRAAQERFVACFALQYGIARFDESFSMGAGRRPIPLDTVQALALGLERFYDRARLERELPVSAASRVYPVDPTRRPWLAEGLGTIDARIRRLAEDGPTLTDIVRLVQRTEEDVRRRLYALYCLGLIGFEIGAPDALVCEDTPPPRSLPDAARRTRSAWLLDRLKPQVATPAPPPERVALIVEHLGPTPERISTPPRAPSSPPGERISTTQLRAPSPDGISTTTVRAPSSPPAERISTTQMRAPSPDGISTTTVRAPSSPPAERISTTTVRAPSSPPAERISTTPPRASCSPPTERISTPPRASAAPPERVPTPSRAMMSARSRLATPSSRPAVVPPAPGKDVRKLVEDAELARLSGDRLRAIVLLREAQQLQPDSPLVLGDLAIALFQQDPRRWAREANILARTARQADPSLPRPYVVLGMLLEQVAEPIRAVQLYRYALARDPECVEAQECLERLGQAA